MLKSSKYKYQVLERDGKDEGIVALNKIQTQHPGPTTGEGGDEGNGGTSNPKQPKSPRKSLDERIANALTIALKPVVNHLEHIDSRLDRLEVRMTKVEDTLQEHGKDIKNIHSILERNNIR
jgi:hypothetical protein